MKKILVAMLIATMMLLALSAAEDVINSTFQVFAPLMPPRKQPAARRN